MSLTYADDFLRVTKDVKVRKDIIALAQQRSSFPSICILALIIFFTCSGMSIVDSTVTGMTVWATVLIVLAKIWAWYLSHDCAHNSLFRSRKMNALLGETLSFFNGLSFFSFDSYRKDHARHHAEKIDIAGFDIAAFSETHPKWFRAIMMAEKLYVPVFYDVIKLINIRCAIVDGTRGEAVRAIGATFAYVTILTLLAQMSLMLIVVWLVSSWLRIHLVRFVDCFQHAYQQLEMPEAGTRYDRRYEIQYTFSVPVARRFTFLNLIILNFGYHTAHHCFPTCPWYNLPKLEQMIIQEMPFSENASEREGRYTFLDFVRAYHRHRSIRMVSDDEGSPYDADGRFNIQHFTGAYTDKLLG